MTKKKKLLLLFFIVASIELMKTLWFFGRPFPKFIENKYFVWHWLILKVYCPPSLHREPKNSPEWFWGFGFQFLPRVRKRNTFFSNKVLLFHLVPFLQKIRKILKLFCNFRWQMRVQVDRWKEVNSQDPFPLEIINEKNLQNLTLCQRRRSRGTELNS